MSFRSCMAVIVLWMEQSIAILLAYQQNDIYRQLTPWPHVVALLQTSGDPHATASH
jgi:hypothetical protein